MKFTQKIFLGTAAVILASFTNAQSLAEGIASIDSHKYAKAKKNFEDMVAKSPIADNYFYLGNTYLKQNEPDFTTAELNFKKGLVQDSKNFLNRIGLASVKLGKGDKSALSEIEKIVKESKEKDPEVIFRAAEALTLFEKNNNPDLAVQLLDKAIEKVMKKGVPAHYYYSLGDAFRQKLSNSPQVAGNAMSAYEKALEVAQNKASVYTRIATLWMQAQKWQLAKQNLDKAIAADPTYAPAYKALAGYEMKFQENARATQALVNYSKFSDNDVNTQLDISKLYFINQDYTNSRLTLDKVFNDVKDPIKYKLKAYLDYADKNFVEAKNNLTTFMNTVEDKKRIIEADKGLEGLIIAALAKDVTDPAQKSAMLSEAKQKIEIAKKAKDLTMDWDNEYAKTQGGGADQKLADAGPQSPEIQILKKKIAENPKDVESIVKLGTAYQEVQNWNGAILAWDKMIALSPSWSYSYYAKGVAYQQLQNDEFAEMSYQKYIDTVSKESPEQQKAQNDPLAYAYFIVAYYNQKTDVAKAKEYCSKSLALNPANQDAVNLNKQLNK